jgi:hypothetical protein
VSRDQPRDALFRAAAAAFRGKVLQGDPEVLTMGDAAANLVLRAAKNPALLATGAWANQLAATAIDDMLVGLAGPCAAAELRRLGLRVEFGQTVCSALKMILPGSWAMRATGHVQVINSCNW